VNKYERLAAVITVMLGALTMYYSWRVLNLGSIFMPDAGFFPFLCGAGLIILGVIWTLKLQLSHKATKDEAAEKSRWHRPLISLLLMVVYGWAFETIGYLTSTMIFMVAWQQIIEREKWGKTLIISFLGTIAMYALFAYVLKVPIPQEFFLR